ncbi:hypothetical protein BDK92_0002 [Micromonospora pisi]|uniref:Uncharacterized protein n=1 Tax=Micromonospora pisi TaxID=589240 RepID=A0A495JAE6_9ACTN|nr:hypothetical protein [Micromonospora pisi]RKR85793.1 hypothetical protein BDK92_0002 [Micromonospora pisi]
MATGEESVEHFSDEELAYLRHLRFGQLPPRVLPEDHVPLIETDHRPDRPEPTGGEDEWMLRNAGG